MPADAAPARACFEARIRRPALLRLAWSRSLSHSPGAAGPSCFEGAVPASLTNRSAVVGTVALGQPLRFSLTGLSPGRRGGGRALRAGGRAPQLAGLRHELMG